MHKNKQLNDIQLDITVSIGYRREEVSELTGWSLQSGRSHVLGWERGDVGDVASIATDAAWSTTGRQVLARLHPRLSKPERAPLAFPDTPWPLLRHTTYHRQSGPGFRHGHG